MTRIFIGPKAFFAFAIILGGVFSAQYLSAEERNHPTLNSIGRFWGIGWSQGYHSGSADGRFERVKDRHPSSRYGSSNLTNLYRPGHEQISPQYEATFPSWSDGGTGVPSISRGVHPHNSPAMNPLPAINSAHEPKPVDSSPKPHLQPDVSAEGIKATTPANPAASPSDLQPKTTESDDKLISPQSSLRPSQYYYSARQNQMRQQ